jgi:adenylate kinase family enzyme
MVIGGPGSGKSTLARLLGQRTGLPVYHLDQLYWRRGWVAAPKTEWLDQINRITASQRWITEGGYSSTFPIRMPRSDTIIWLDFSRWVCMPRLLKRTILNYGRVREDLAEGCPERLDLAFFRYAWTFQKAHAASYREALESYAVRAKLANLTSPGEVQGFLARLET